MDRALRIHFHPLQSSYRAAVARRIVVELWCWDKSHNSVIMTKQSCNTCKSEWHLSPNAHCVAEMLCFWSRGMVVGWWNGLENNEPSLNDKFESGNVWGHCLSVHFVVFSWQHSSQLAALIHMPVLLSFRRTIMFRFFFFTTINRGPTCSSFECNLVTQSDQNGKRTKKQQS